jgi:ATP-dependent Clp protease ATP-binding subunit ClpX
MFSFFKKIPKFLFWKYWDFKHPQISRPYGITCYVGLPGFGKTLSLVEKLLELKRKYPKAIIITNFGFKYQDYDLKDWRDFVNIENGEDGVIFGVDEVQDIFNRTDWQNMPKAILSIFAQNRKHAKQFVCTSQSFADIVIDIRRRAHFIIECRNLANRWIFQRAFTPDEYTEKDGVYIARRRAWRYSFIATNDIYDSYDTYEVIRKIMTEKAPSAPAP